MTYESFEEVHLKVESVETVELTAAVRKAFGTSLEATDGVIACAPGSAQSCLGKMLGIEGTLAKLLLPEAFETMQKALRGEELPDGSKSLSLYEINTWKRNEEFYAQNTRQQAGYAAEVISTWKENLIAKATGSELTTRRADDCSEYGYKKNDQFVDKVRIDADGNIVERIQTKFVGKNGSEWLAKAMSKSWEKYLDGPVDKLECPKNYYDDIVAGMDKRRALYERQLERTLAEGKTDAAASIEARLKKLDRIGEMLEQSTVTSDEAYLARENPKAYVAKTFAAETIKFSNAEGLKGGAFAAGVTFTVSTASNVERFVNGEISAQEMAVEIIGDTAMAGGIGYGTSFVTTAVANTMGGSSCALISRIGGTCAPAAVISFAVESYDECIQYAEGRIDASEFAYKLGENAASVAGSLGGGAAAGALMGTAFGPAGTVVGGVVGGLVGCVVASEAYSAAIELGSEGAEVCMEKASEFANGVVSDLASVSSEGATSAVAAFNEFFADNDIPISVKF